MVTVVVILAVAALIAAIVSAMGHCPIWVPVIFLAIVVLLVAVPAGVRLP